jgi:hypothetical protein
MKHYIYILCCLCILSAPRLYGQASPSIAIGGGYQAPLKKESFSPQLITQLGFHYPLLGGEHFSLGASLGGDYGFSKSAILPSKSGIPVAESFSSVLYENRSNSSGQRNYGWRIGPQVNFQTGKFLLSGILQTGQSYWENAGYSIEQEIDGGTRPMRKELYAREDVKSSSWLFSPRLKAAYPISKRVYLWAEASLATSRVHVKERFLDFSEGTVVDEKTIGNFMEAQSVASESGMSWNSSSVQLGLSFQLGKSSHSESSTGTKSTKADMNTSRSNIKSQRAETKNKNPLYEDSGPRGNNPFYQGRHASNEIPENPTRIIVPVYPENNARFSEEKSLKELRWQVVGTKINAPNYIVELQRVDDRGRQMQAYHAKTTSLAVSAEEVAKGALPEGMYRWQVREISTGVISTPQFFSVGSCQIHFTIENDTITCLGYEGENRKYRICFNSVYASTSGDLTYAQPGSGLNLFDQNYATLSYTLVSPNTGNASSTVQYCVEVLVSPSVTSIGIGLQGDDLDPTPILCQPGVAIVLDSLPECICEECDDMMMDIVNMQVANYNGQLNQFEFSGDLQVNQPIYAVELQVLSFSYAAQPSPCSSGVSVLEEAGMILRPGTTINTSTDIQFMNSVANPNANGNAAKVIKYQGSAAMTGDIPMNIIVGLPGPISGFDSSCCKLDYEVCFRLLVYYDEHTCKSCEFTKCFQFSNQ